jgi:hypothetical protein
MYANIDRNSFNVNPGVKAAKLDTWILPHESRGAAEVLPRQRGVAVVVVDEDAVETARPLDGVDHLRI